MSLSAKTLSKKNYNAIDAAKLICAILIVMIHVEPFGAAAPGQSYITVLNFLAQQYLARIAVPFFFVTNGFLLYRKTSYKEFETEHTVRYLKRILRLYLVWTIIYFPIRLPDFLNNEKGLLYAVMKYIRDIVFAGSCAHLWYFPALIFAVALTSFLLSKKVSPLTILLVSAAFYFLGLFAQSWFGFILPVKQISPEIWTALKQAERIIVTTRDGLFDAFFFVSMGMYIAFSNIRIKPEKAAFLFGISMLALLAEALALQHYGFAREHDMYLFLGPAAFFLFCFLINIELDDSPAYRKMRSLSTLIFCIHPLFLYYLTVILTKASGRYFAHCNLFLLTLATAVLSSLIVIRLSEYRRLRWLRVLYT